METLELDSVLSSLKLITTVVVKVSRVAGRRVVVVGLVAPADFEGVRR